MYFDSVCTLPPRYGGDGARRRPSNPVEEAAARRPATFLDWGTIGGRRGSKMVLRSQHLWPGGIPASGRQITVSPNRTL